jgi:enoyl-CoA hydratase
VARTRELFLLGRYIDAPTAMSWGLVNRLSSSEDLEALTLTLASELAGNAPLSQIGNKRVIAALLRAEGELLAESKRN